MKIVHFIKWLRLRDGGTVRAVLDMCEGLASRGHEVIAASADDSGVPEAWKDEGHRHAAGKAGRLPRNLLLTLSDPLFERGGHTIAEATRDTLTQFLTGDSMVIARQTLEDADALHVHGVWANSNHQMIGAARTLGVPHIISPHGMLDDWSMSQGALKKKLHLTMLSGSALRTAKAVHCTASAELEQSSRWFPKERGVVIPLLFDTKPFYTLPGPSLARSTFPWLNTGRPVLLFLSRLNVKKGVELLLRAVGAHRELDCELVLAGPSDPPEYLAHLQAVANELGISDRVHFPGMVNGELKWSLYQACDVFALPTSQENFGYVLLEALACGKPVVTTTGVDIWPELEQSRGASVIRACGDACIPALGTELARLLADSGLRATMGEQGRNWALKFLDREAVLDAMERMYSAK